MPIRSGNVVGGLVVLGPTLALVAISSGIVPIEGGHGLAAWFLESVCVIGVLVGALLNGLWAQRASGQRALHVAMACVGAAVVLGFVVRFGIPFSR